MKPTLKLCSSQPATGISKTPDLVTSLEPVPLLFRARGTTRESLIEGAKQKHTQREGLYDLRIRCRGVGQVVEQFRKSWFDSPHWSTESVSGPLFLTLFHIRLVFPIAVLPQCRRVKVEISVVTVMFWTVIFRALLH